MLIFSSLGRVVLSEQASRPIGEGEFKRLFHCERRAGPVMAARCPKLHYVIGHLGRECAQLLPLGRLFVCPSAGWLAGRRGKQSGRRSRSSN